MESGRAPLQIAFAILYLGFALIVLLAAIWTAIAVVTVSFGLSVCSSAQRQRCDWQPACACAGPCHRWRRRSPVPHLQQDDFGNSQPAGRNHRGERRHRRPPALYRGGAVWCNGGSHRCGRETAPSPSSIRPRKSFWLCHPPNSSAHRFPSPPRNRKRPGRGVRIRRVDFRQQINIMRRGKERTLSVQVTREDARDGRESHVITLDDITDLVIAQRSTAWSDVARRIAHEIKNR